ncbi:ATP11-domain-containing protein [Suhomyces tanzawaensis NRRL Y-17324]|uniref:ATP11-domain-containing protein n=1 Tax=Suhomyces tanzawaensis NRRL Y-17324 TaxID=984487 RepID=A0A1E4SRG0_9ASCO|nr:ATP11-domain-containing protein [Suhomyces tanzawaensis NRRL Y-17324]ODV82085.1 ATP11-domain-containing protein [Suhomyces tanzawaensis NRRL Y-17324]
MMLTRTLLRTNRRVICSAFGRRLNHNDALSKYREKLAQKAKELGLNDVNELKTKLKDEIEEKKKEFSKIDPLQELEEYERRQAEERQRDQDSKTINVRNPIAKDAPQAPYKTMNSYVDVEKAKDLPRKELEFLWRARFQNKERSLHAVVDSVQFSTMYANAFKNPSFILPLPKNEEGYEMHFVQWSFVGPKTTHCMLTTVAEYKLHKEYAKPHTSLMFHQEFAEDKEVVLMNGTVETESSLTMDEAQLLVLNVQRFYGGIGKSDRKLELLRAFTTGDQEFNMEDLIKEATTFE